MHNLADVAGKCHVPAKPIGARRLGSPCVWQNHIVGKAYQVDGNKCPKISLPCEAIVKGDSKVQAISAASILAKVARDAELYKLDKLYPQYGFAKHKGYPTAAHCLALQAHGICPQHRLSYAPVRALINVKLGDVAALLA